MRELETTLAVLLIAASPAIAQAPPPEADAAAADEPGLEYYAAEPVLRAYVDQALRANPALQEALARYRAARERVPQVEALPDPRLGYTQAVESVETRVGPQRSLLSLSQTFPWFGKRGLRGDVANQQAVARYHLFVAQQWEVIAQVKGSFYALGYLDAAIRITEEERSILDHYESLAQSRYAAGEGLQQPVIKIQAEITKVINRAEILRQQRESAAARLNTLLDRPAHMPVEPVRSLHLPDLDLDLETLYEMGDQNRQELKAAQALVEGRERAVKLAEKDFWPDFSVSAGLVVVGGRSDPAGILMPPPDDGKNAFNLSVGLSIPLWRGKYRAGVRQAAEELVAERQSYAKQRNAMEFSIRDEVVRIQTFEDQVSLFENALIPQAEEALRSTEAGYETGQLGVLELLDSERVLLNVRLTNAQYHSELLSALARLERAVGTAFPEGE